MPGRSPWRFPGSAGIRRLEAGVHGAESLPSWAGKTSFSSVPPPPSRTAPRPSGPSPGTRRSSSTPGTSPRLLLRHHPIHVVRRAFRRVPQDLGRRLEAQGAAIDRAAPGVVLRRGRGRAEGDREGGLRGVLPPSTRHGLGIDVHEGPYMVAHDKTLLEPGMTFTSEPGIYLPGRFGVRIEDDILCTEREPSRSPRASSGSSRSPPDGPDRASSGPLAALFVVAARILAQPSAPWSRRPRRRGAGRPPRSWRAARPARTASRQRIGWPRDFSARALESPLRPAAGADPGRHPSTVRETLEAPSASSADVAWSHARPEGRAPRCFSVSAIPRGR